MALNWDAKLGRELPVRWFLRVEWPLRFLLFLHCSLLGVLLKCIAEPRGLLGQYESTRQSQALGGVIYAHL